MTRHLLIGLIAFVTGNAVAQSQPTTLYFLNTSVYHTYSVQTSANQKKGVTVSPKNFQRLVLPTDSLVIYVDGEPKTARFTPGKTHYYVAQSENPAPSFLLFDVPEAQFWLSASINKAKKQEPFGIILSQ